MSSASRLRTDSVAWAERLPQLEDAASLFVVGRTLVGGDEGAGDLVVVGVGEVERAQEVVVDRRLRRLDENMRDEREPLGADSEAE